MKVYTIATRGSKLALWQTMHVKELLEKKGVKTEIKIIKTKGDKIQDRFLHEIGGKGLFVKELETAMQEGAADLAVHSLKDLPAKTPEGFVMGAILKRHSPFDVLILKDGGKISEKKELLTKEELASYGKVTLASASLRRQSLIKHFCKDALLRPIRGNVDTRIKKLEEKDFDGIILAKAAMERLSFPNIKLRTLDPSWFVPSPAQGALAIECLEDHPIKSVLEELDHKKTRTFVEIERKTLLALGGDCTMPIGCFVFEENGSIKAHCKVLDYEGDAAETRLTLTDGFDDLDKEKAVSKILEGLDKDGLQNILEALKKDPPDLGELL